MVIENAREEAGRMHVAISGNLLPAPAAKAIPTTDPDWEENASCLAGGHSQGMVQGRW